MNVVISLLFGPELSRADTQTYTPNDLFFFSPPSSSAQTASQIIAVALPSLSFVFGLLAGALYPSRPLTAASLSIDLTQRYALDRESHWFTRHAIATPFLRGISYGNFVGGIRGRDPYAAGIAATHLAVGLWR